MGNLLQYAVPNERCIRELPHVNGVAGKRLKNCVHAHVVAESRVHCRTRFLCFFADAKAESFREPAVFKELFLGFLDLLGAKIRSIGRHCTGCDFALEGSFFLFLAHVQNLNPVRSSARFVE